MNITRGHPMSIGKNLFHGFGIVYTGLERFRRKRKKPRKRALIPNNAPAGTEFEQITFKAYIQTTQDAVEDEIKKWLDNGTIVEIPADEDNRWNFPLTTTMKKNQKIRTCLDVILLNQYLKSDMHEIPLLSIIFDPLRDARVYTTLDLASAFNRFPVKKSDQHKLAFTSPKIGTRYMFQGCPFGLNLFRQNSKKL
ncbi:hypothetical protein INT45_014011 [Circinella minor]|uniref:Reverse transcriptase domain-containing protein n=1 Tax=Circinella minor TaxID=1195481 RepID=A0A8H7S1U5_9FUNG|nr:hypothetical protein INT45_014011 [Circinella minor]